MSYPSLRDGGVDPDSGSEFFPFSSPAPPVNLTRKRITRLEVRTVSAQGDSTYIEVCLVRLRAGETAARDELIRPTVRRLERLAHKMLRGQFGRIGRWLDTGDVLQSATLRLWRALGEVVPESPLHFHRLAARFVRLELLDLARHYYGPQGVGANHESQREGDRSGTAAADDQPGPVVPPSQALEWADLHAAVQALPEDEAAVTDLLFYQGLTQDEAALLLRVDVRTVQRRWQRARRTLGELLAAD